MFKSLVQSIFPSVATEQEFTPDYTSFERSRVTTEEDPLAIPSNKPQPNKIPKAGPFYDYLFGDSSQQLEQDPLSLYVANKINEIILQPQQLLEELPVMPTSVATVVSLLEDTEFNLDELLKVIEQEPSMAADMIQLANSTKYKRGDKQVTDLQRAFMCMGAEGLKEGVIQVFLQKFSASSNLYFKQFGEKIWQHSFTSAQFAQRLAQQYLSPSDANTVYLVGLLRNLGTMVIFQLMLEAFKHVDPDAQPSSASFKSLMAEQSVNLTVIIAKHWQLPSRIIDILEAQLKDDKESISGALCVFEANIISEAKSLFDGKRIATPTFEQYINTKLQRDFSKEFALSLLPEPINS